MALEDQEIFSVLCLKKALYGRKMNDAFETAAFCRWKQYLCCLKFGSYQSLHMEAIADPEHQLRIEGSVPNFQIDPRMARFPCCIVWTPIPVISWLVPFIGHLGICREDGVILDFAGPNYVSVDNFAFGAVARYLQISKEKCELCFIDPLLQDESGRETLTWDDALRKGTQEYQHRFYNLFTCNCHCFVANNLNRTGFRGGGWNVVNLASLIFLKGKWVSTTSIMRSFLPFVIIMFLGLAFGGSTFLTFLAFFTFILVGWFLLGTYCFTNFIQL